ncbi:MAG: hypothetical protein HKO85_03445 [Xanthomonadales bacterium]|nr:hypothetical protein [Gammaproteobacteria bacterium]MBT8050858.1 hypothetical protein [Gammaproteobacteria bacterium]MBT8055900.1 hypothetical protein [Gammaproteobacteria bacterium]NNJ78196.1 hypothetical protein [Xanthomonadales bacterium]NNL04317.1 hypothetical protein [Xanthomonadales bacterium]
MIRKSKIAVLALVASLAAGCAAGLGYNQLDWLIPWYVDGYVDLSGEQRDTLRDHLEPRLEWHREEELARYVALLDGIENDLSGPVEPLTVQGWAQEIIDAAVRVERNMISVGLAFGEDMSDEQMQEFVDSLWERQSEYEQEFLDRSDARYAEDDYDKLKGLLTRFMGRLSSTQKEALREASRDLERFDRAWLDERRGWLHTLEPLLLDRADDWQQTAMVAYESRLRERTPEYHASLDHNLSRISAAFAIVVGQMTPRQHKKARAELDDLRDTLRDLMRHETAALPPCGRSQPETTTRKMECRFWA